MDEDSVPTNQARGQRSQDRPVMADLAGPNSSMGPLASMGNRIVQAALEAIVTVDEEQRIVMINPAAQRMFGYTAPEVLGKNLSQLIPGRYRKAHAAHVRQFDQAGVAERAMGQRSPIVGLRANGEEFPMQASICRLDVADSFGPRRFFAALMCDLSDVDRLRDQIEDYNKRLRVIFEAAPIAIWIIDHDQIIFANRACATLFEVADPQALVGRSIYTLLGPDSHERVRDAVVQALASEKPIIAGKERIARADGSVREVEIAAAALPDHGHTVLQMAITDVTAITLESRDLKTSREQLRQLSASLVDAREEERRRIARELHDELGQRLTALHMELSSLQASALEPAAKERIASMLGMVDETMASVRRIATELRPLMLDDLGLVSAIEWLSESWARRMGIEVSLDIGQDDPPVSCTACIALYRMVQEALTNIARHAQATRVRIRMRQQAGELVLTVRDNGIGFSEQSMLREGSHGLVGIRERAYMLGGHLEIGNASKGGGRIQVRLPLIATTHDATAPTVGQAGPASPPDPVRPIVAP